MKKEVFLAQGVSSEGTSAYVSPAIEIVEVMVERGFAASNDGEGEDGGEL